MLNSFLAELLSCIISIEKPLGNSTALNPHTCHMVPDTCFIHIHMHMQMHVSVTFY